MATYIKSVPLDSTNSSQSDTLQQKTDRLLHLLDSEIDQIIADQTRPGWTLWAILGGLEVLRIL